MLRPPILVTGPPRSGTSLVAGLLGKAGAWLGKTVGKGPSNPRGFFENLRLREEIDKELLRALGCDPLGVRLLPPPRLAPAFPWLAGKVEEIVRQQRYRDPRSWLFKDAKLTLLWPHWRNAFPDATWVIVRRDPEEIVDSCLRTHFMANHSRERDFWRAFVAEYQCRLSELRKSGASCVELAPADLLGGRFDPLLRLASDQELKLTARTIRRFLLPRAWHGSTGS